MGKKGIAIGLAFTGSAMMVFFVNTVQVFIALIQSLQADSIYNTVVLLLIQIILILGELIFALKFRDLWTEF